MYVFCMHVWMSACIQTCMHVGAYNANLLSLRLRLVTSVYYGVAVDMTARVQTGARLLTTRAIIFHQQ